MAKSSNALDYIRAEFYKVLHRKYTYWFLLAMLAGAGVLVWGWTYTNARGNNMADFTNAIVSLVMLLSVGSYCTLITGDMVFSDQYKFNTLKNEVSYGIPRVRIYLCKLFTSCVTALIACAIIIGFYLGLCWLFLPNAGTAGEAMKMVGTAILNALPLWLGAQAVVMFCLSIFKSSTVASFIFIGIIMLLPEGLKLMGMLVDPVFQTISEFTLTSPFSSPDFMISPDSFVRCLAVGVIWFVAATLAGMLTFHKREIN